MGAAFVRGALMDEDRLGSTRSKKVTGDALRQNVGLSSGEPYAATIPERWRPNSRLSKLCRSPLPTPNTRSRGGMRAMSLSRSPTATSSTPPDLRTATVRLATHHAPRGAADAAQGRLVRRCRDLDPGDHVIAHRAHCPSRSGSAEVRRAEDAAFSSRPRRAVLRHCRSGVVETNGLEPSTPALQRRLGRVADLRRHSLHRP